MRAVNAMGHALVIAGSMTWEVLWALVLGFTLSAVVQAVVRRQTIARLLGDDRPKTLVIAGGLGAASSSCSYAAVALARSLFRKGASFTAAIAFEIASTNLVIELGIILALVIGWQFTLAEFVGGIVMIGLLAVVFRLTLTDGLVEGARAQAERGLVGSMEGHAGMDMSVQTEGPLRRRLLSAEGRTAVSHIFVMEWAAVLRDIVIGLFIAGAAAAWIPDTFWRAFFLQDHPILARIWGPIIGPVVAVASFVCSIGNVPLAGVLWNGGISFGGVTSFIYADLIILPIIVIYRKYYGTRVALYLTACLYLTMVAAGYVIEIVFAVAHLVPEGRHAKVMEASVTWNYTTFLNIAAIAFTAILLIRFLRTGGARMMKGMHDVPSGDVAQNQAD